jgi:hypothetical protein
MFKPFLSISLKLFILSCFILISLSTSGQKKDYYNAVYTNTIDGYSHFIKKHPKSKYIHLIKSRLEECEFYVAINKNSIPLFNEFLIKYPKSQYKDTVTFTINELVTKQEWILSKENNTIEDYQDFIKKYPDSKYTDIAKLNIQAIQLKTEAELYKESPERLNLLLDKYSSLTTYPEYDELKKNTKEKLWAAIRDSASEEMLDMFLMHFPESNEAGEAWKLMETICPESALFYFNMKEQMMHDPESSGYDLIIARYYLDKEAENTCLVFKDTDYNFISMDQEGGFKPFNRGFSLPIIKYLPPKSFYIIDISMKDLSTNRNLLNILNKLLHYYSRHEDFGKSMITILFKENVEDKNIVESIRDEIYDTDEIKRVLSDNQSDTLELILAIQSIKKENINYLKEYLTSHFHSVNDSVKLLAYTTYLNFDRNKKYLLMPLLDPASGINDNILGLDLISSFKLSGYQKQISELLKHPEHRVYRLAYTTYFDRGYKENNILSDLLSTDNEATDLILGEKLITEYKLPGYEEHLLKILSSKDSVVINQTVFCLATMKTSRSISILDSVKHDIIPDLIYAYAHPDLKPYIKDILVSLGTEIVKPAMNFIEHQKQISKNLEGTLNGFYFSSPTSEMEELIAGLGPDAINELSFYVTDNKKPYTLDALNIIRMIGDKKATPFVLPLFFSDDEEIQARAVLCYTNIRDTSCIKKLNSLAITSDDEYLIQVTFLAAKFQKDKLAIPVLKHYLKHWKYSRESIEILKNDLKWSPENIADSVYVNIAQRNKKWLLNNWSSTDMVLSHDLFSIQYFVFKNAIFTYFGLGNTDVIDKLAYILTKRGNVVMATRYLNCGVPRLVSAAKSWASKHGYNIQTTFDNVPVLKWDDF